MRILDLVGPVEGRRILDLGCGDGLLTWTLADRGARAVGIDVDRAMLDVASARSVRIQRQRPRFVEGRTEQLPFPDASFDVVVIVTVLCLVADRAGAVREAARVPWRSAPDVQRFRRPRYTSSHRIPTRTSARMVLRASEFCVKTVSDTS